MGELAILPVVQHGGNTTTEMNLHTKGERATGPRGNEKGTGADALNKLNSLGSSVRKANLGTMAKQRQPEKVRSGPLGG